MRLLMRFYMQCSATSIQINWNISMFMLIYNLLKMEIWYFFGNIELTLD